MTQVTQALRCPGVSIPDLGKRQTGGQDGRTGFIPQERMEELRNLTGTAFRYTRDRGNPRRRYAVSYTHLTLPTIYSV